MPPQMAHQRQKDLCSLFSQDDSLGVMEGGFIILRRGTKTKGGKPLKRGGSILVTCLCCKLVNCRFPTCSTWNKCKIVCKWKKHTAFQYWYIFSALLPHHQYLAARRTWRSRQTPSSCTLGWTANKFGQFNNISHLWSQPSWRIMIIMTSWRHDIQHKCQTLHWPGHTGLHSCGLHWERRLFVQSLHSKCGFDRRLNHWRR